MSIEALKGRIGRLQKSSAPMICTWLDFMEWVDSGCSPNAVLDPGFEEQLAELAA
jgi:hypothetical protein